MMAEALECEYGDLDSAFGVAILEADEVDVVGVRTVGAIVGGEGAEDFARGTGGIVRTAGDGVAINDGCPD